MMGGDITMDIFNETKKRINITDVCAAYGIEIKHQSGNKLFTRCCFHNEKTASLSIYPETNSFYCYGCGAGGDTVSFVEKLFNLDPLEAALKLNEDFQLGIDVKKPPDKEQIQAADDGAKLLKDFETWIKNAYITLCDYFHILQDFKDIYKPKHIKESYHNLFAEACQNLAYIEYLIDTLLNAEFETELEFYNVYGEEVERIGRRIIQARKDSNDKKSA